MVSTAPSVMDSNVRTTLMCYLSSKGPKAGFGEHLKSTSRDSPLVFALKISSELSLPPLV